MANPDPGFASYDDEIDPRLVQVELWCDRCRDVDYAPDTLPMEGETVEYSCIKRSYTCKRCWPNIAEPETYIVERECEKCGLAYYDGTRRRLPHERLRRSGLNDDEIPERVLRRVQSRDDVILESYVCRYCWEP